LELIPILKDLTGLELAWLAGTYVFGFVVKGFFGFGAVPPMLLVGSLLMPPHQAVLLAGLVNAMSQAFLVPDGVRHGARGMAGGMALLVVPGLLIGVLVFREMSSDRLQLVLGLVILALVFLDGPGMRPLIEPLILRSPRIFGVCAAAMTGLMAGLIGAGGMIFMSTYLRYRIGDHLRFRGTIILIVTAMLVTRTVFLVAEGLVNQPLTLQALAFVPAGFLGAYIGSWLSRRLSNDRYFRVYRAFLIVSALAFTVRAIT